MSTPDSPQRPQQPAAPGGSNPTGYGPSPHSPAPPAYPAAPPSYGTPPAPGMPGYPAPQGYGGYPAQPKTNTLAIVSLISSIAGLIIVPFIGSLVGVITGHLSLSQLKSSAESGRGMALAGTIVGWVGLALTIIGIIVLVAAWGWLISNADQFATVT